MFPKVFDPINRLGFPHHARTFTYINGAVETVLGAMMASPRTHRHSGILSIGYVGYLTANIVRTQAARLEGDARKASAPG